VCMQARVRDAIRVHDNVRRCHRTVEATVTQLDRLEEVSCNLWHALPTASIYFSFFCENFSVSGRFHKIFYTVVKHKHAVQNWSSVLVQLQPNQN
jgi:hypothetical protein